MPKALIRRGIATDAPALAEIAARTFADAFGADNHPEDLQAHLSSSYGVTQQFQELNDPNVTTLLACASLCVVGYAQIRYHSPPPCVVVDQPIELHRFYVDRSAHGTGVAQILMAAVRSVAVERGGRHLWLGVWERNPRAIAFYRKVGYAEVGSTYFCVGSDRQTDRVMVAAVNPQASG